MAGPVGRLLAQFVLTGVNILTKAGMQAYQQAKAGEPRRIADVLAPRPHLPCHQRHALGFALLPARLSPRPAGGGAAASAASKGASAVGGSRMPIDQARSILQVEAGASRAAVLEQFDKYYASNDPEKGGSFYVQSKIWNAKEVMLAVVAAEEKRRAGAAAGAGAAGGGGGGGSSSKKEHRMQ